MSRMKELAYPEAAGWKDPEVSRDNAKRIEGTGRAATLRHRLAVLFNNGFIGTADEAAARIEEPILAVRPRCTELSQLGLVERVPGLRHRSAGGGAAAVLRSTANCDLLARVVAEINQTEE